MMLEKVQQMRERHALDNEGAVLLNNIESEISRKKFTSL
jgi:hypothetical protein